MSKPDTNRQANPPDEVPEPVDGQPEEDGREREAADDGRRRERERGDGSPDGARDGRQAEQHRAEEQQQAAADEHRRDGDNACGAREPVSQKCWVRSPLRCRCSCVTCSGFITALRNVLLYITLIGMRGLLGFESGLVVGCNGGERSIRWGRSGRLQKEDSALFRRSSELRRGNRNKRTPLSSETESALIIPGKRFPKVTIQYRMTLIFLSRPFILSLPKLASEITSNRKTREEVSLCCLLL